MATKKITKRKLWILGIGVLLAVLVLASQRDGGVGGGGFGPGGVGAVGPCTVKVTADTLNVRSGPDDSRPVVDTVSGGAKISADRTIRNGFRQLGANRWAAQQYLELVAGDNCG